MQGRGEEAGDGDLCVSRLEGRSGDGAQHSQETRACRALWKRSPCHSFQSSRNCVSLAPHRNGKDPPRVMLVSRHVSPQRFTSQLQGRAEHVHCVLNFLTFRVGALYQK